MKLESLLELEKEVSRRGFLTGAMRSVGGMAALVPLLEKLASAQAVDERQPYNVLGAIGASLFRKMKIRAGAPLSRPSRITLSIFLSARYS